MKRLIRLLVFILLMLSTACAPSSGMIATLTMLPGTPTPTRSVIYPTRTVYPTNTLAPVAGMSPTDTPIPPADCPTNTIDTALPEDPSQLPGRHYDLHQLPGGYDLQASAEMADSRYQWVNVKWQGRSLYWIQRLVCRDRTGTGFWEIVDVLALPRLDALAGEADTMLCYTGEKRLPLAVAYGMYDPARPAQELTGAVRGWSLKVESAWQITDRFVPLETKGLSCIVESTRRGGSNQAAR